MLADCFDLIGGTSTGAIIASALALGWTVDRIEKLYLKLGNSIFKSSFFRRGYLNACLTKSFILVQMIPLCNRVD